MTTEEIRKNAPKGATHYDINELDYLKYNGQMEWDYYNQSKWVVCIIDINYVIANVKPL